MREVARSYMPRYMRRWLGAVRGRVIKSFYVTLWKLSRFDLPTSGIALSYAGVLTGRGGPALHGGAVKLIHLQHKFPENTASFNILYLVSSALPKFALEYASEMKRRGVKLVWNQNGVAYPALSYIDWASTNQNMRALLQLADYVVYQSSFCRMCADRFLAEDHSPWEIVYNCVDTDVFTPGHRVKSDAPIVLLAAGTHQHRERISIALDVLHRLQREGARRYTLSIAGALDWPGGNADVARMIDELGLQAEVDIIPPFDHKNAPDIYRSADILLHLKYKDPCPTVVIEAMACGVPVVGSNSGGMPELLGEQGGILLDVPESWDSLHVPTAEQIAAAVDTISGDLPLWSGCCRAHAVDKFGCEKWLAEHERIFRKLVA